MQLSSREVVFKFLQFAQEAEILSSGRLMSPDELAEFRYSDGSRVREEISGWTFCGDVNPLMLGALAQGTPIVHSAAIWIAPEGTPILALQQKAGDWAHRFIVSLAGHTIRECMGEFGRTPINASLSTRFGEAALVLPIAFSAELASALEQTIALEKVTATALANDLVSGSLRFLRPDAMKGHSKGIRTVCVSAVCTPEVGELMVSHLPSGINMMH